MEGVERSDGGWRAEIRWKIKSRYGDEDWVYG